MNLASASALLLALAEAAGGAAPEAVAGRPGLRGVDLPRARRAQSGTEPCDFDAREYVDQAHTIISISVVPEDPKERMSLAVSRLGCDNTIIIDEIARYGFRGSGYSNRHDVCIPSHGRFLFKFRNSQYLFSANGLAIDHYAPGGAFATKAALAQERRELDNPAKSYCGTDWDQAEDDCNNDVNAVPCPNNMPCPNPCPNNMSCPDKQYCFPMGGMCTPKTFEPAQNREVVMELGPTQKHEAVLDLGLPCLGYR